MRFLTSLLCLVVGTTAVAAETWRWVDANGVVHYSDQPHPGAERIEIAGAPPPGAVAPPPAAPRGPVPAAERFTYAGCDLAAPTPDQVFFNVNSVNVAVRVLPGLQPGHTVSVQVNGRPAPGWPAGSTSYLLQNLARGSYQLVALIQDERGAIACRSASTSFHIRQPSVLSPARQGQRGNAPSAAPAPRAPTVPARP